MSFIQSIRRVLYNYGTSSVPSYQTCPCNKTLKNIKNNTLVNGHTRRKRNRRRTTRRTMRGRNKRNRQ